MADNSDKVEVSISCLIFRSAMDASTIQQQQINVHCGRVFSLRAREFKVVLNDICKFSE